MKNLTIVLFLVAGLAMNSLQAKREKPLSEQEIVAVVAAEKALHPKKNGPKNSGQLFKSLESPEEFKPTEELVKNDVGQQKWFYIKSLKPYQITQVTGKSGKVYLINMQNNGTLSISLAKK